MDEMANEMEDFIREKGFEEFARLSGQARAILHGIAPVLRKHEMSFEHYEYISSQIWGNLATSVINEDAEAQA